MKKIILVIAVLFMAVSFTACKETKKEPAAPETEVKDDVAADVYQCPMDCEEGKTYEEAGKCPVCKMDLKLKKAETSDEHAANCKCVEGGECTCEAGKCQCMAEAVTHPKECGKCGADKCESKSAVMSSKSCSSGKCSCKA